MSKEAQRARRSTQVPSRAGIFEKLNSWHHRLGHKVDHELINDRKFLECPPGMNRLTRWPIYSSSIEFSHSPTRPRVLVSNSLGVRFISG